MDVEIINTLSIIIRRERITNNILFMFKNIVPELEETALEHGKHLYTLIKLFSGTCFNIELEEPKYIDFKREELITMCLNDITTYCELVKKNYYNINAILSELIKIKTVILKYLILNEFGKYQNTNEEYTRLEWAEVDDLS